MEVSTSLFCYSYWHKSPKLGQVICTPVGCTDTQSRTKFDAQYCLNVVPFVVYGENPSSSFPATLCLHFVVLLGEQYFFFFSKRLQLITVKHRHTTIWELTDIREAGTERLNGATAYLSVFPRDNMERNRQPPEHNTSHLANRDQLSKKLR